MFNNTILTSVFIGGCQINIYGNLDELFFNLCEVCTALKIDKDNIIQSVDDDYIFYVYNTRKYIKTKDVFLTEDGLYELLYINNDIQMSKDFKKLVKNQIKILRNFEKNQLQNMLFEKETELKNIKEKIYEEIDKPGHVYILKCDSGIKIGKTKNDVSKRIKGLQTGNVSKIEILMDYRTSNEDLLEKIVHYILDKYRCNSGREFFECDLDYMKNIITLSGKFLDTLKSTYQYISPNELYDKLGLESIAVDKNSIDDFKTKIKTFSY